MYKLKYNTNFDVTICYNCLDINLKNVKNPKCGICQTGRQNILSLIKN